MMSVEVVSGTYFHCPLVNRNMCEGECYDVQMVRSDFIKASVLNFDLDKAKSNEICENCTFNQLNDYLADAKQGLVS